MQSVSDSTIKAILADTKVIALVGFSANPKRPSHVVSRYLLSQGYRVIPVNPGLVGQDFESETIRAQLADCPPEVDMVDIFRRSDQAASVVDDALTHLPRLRTIWMQIGVFDQHAITKARAKGLRVVWDRCPKIEYQRLLS